ncbi:MAG TPA: hypothetical protein VE915_07850, partial [Actinomycetota bacterium]|nr:hypothetical protein [Actinomycetota bacterium]
MAQHNPESDARQALGDEEYEQSRAEGYAMSPDDAVAFALESEWCQSRASPSGATTSGCGVSGFAL